MQLYFYVRSLQLGGGGSPEVSQVLEQIGTKFRRLYPHVFGSHFLMVVSAIFKTVPFNCKSKMAAEKWEKLNFLYLCLCSSYNQDFAVDFDIIKSRRPKGIKVRSVFGIDIYVNQYGGRETGSSYNF